MKLNSCHFYGRLTLMTFAHNRTPSIHKLRKKCWCIQGAYLVAIIFLCIQWEKIDVFIPELAAPISMKGGVVDEMISTSCLAAIWQKFRKQDQA